MRKHFAVRDPVMAALIRAAGPYRLAPEGARSPFESLARAITHQQLNGIAAERILGRFVALCGNGAFPEPAAVLARPDHELRAVGLSFAKVASLKDLAEKATNGTVPHGAALATLGDEEIIERLTRVRGIGRWTVEMLLIFQLGRPDVLPVDDFGVRNGFRLAYGLRGMPTPKALAAFGERWAPHRTAAAWYLWRAVDIAKLGKLSAPVEKPRGVRIVVREGVAGKGAKGKGAPRKPAVRKGAAGSARSKSAAAAGRPRAASTRAARDRRGRSRR